MPDQPNKPGGDFDADGEPRAAEDERAVKNQASVTPDAYPENERGRLDEADRKPG